MTSVLNEDPFRHPTWGAPSITFISLRVKYPSLCRTPIYLWSLLKLFRNSHYHLKCDNSKQEIISNEDFERASADYRSLLIILHVMLPNAFKLGYWFIHHLYFRKLNRANSYKKKTNKQKNPPIQIKIITAQAGLNKQRGRVYSGHAHAYR